VDSFSDSFKKAVKITHRRIFYGRGGIMFPILPFVIGAVDLSGFLPPQSLVLVCSASYFSPALIVLSVHWPFIRL